MNWFKENVLVLSKNELLGKCFYGQAHNSNERFNQLMGEVPKNYIYLCVSGKF